MADQKPNKINIIVVEDSQTLRGQIRIILQSGGFGIIEAKNGVEGLATIRSEKSARLVICDLNMPEMDGLEMLQALKADPTCCHLPIIILTAENDKELVGRAHAVGASAWVTKPFQPRPFIDLVKKLVLRDATPPEQGLDRPLR